MAVTDSELRRKVILLRKYYSVTLKHYPELDTSLKAYLIYTSVRAQRCIYNLFYRRVINLLYTRAIKISFIYLMIQNHCKKDFGMLARGTH